MPRVADSTGCDRRRGWNARRDYHSDLNTLNRMFQVMVDMCALHTLYLCTCVAPCWGWLREICTVCAGRRRSLPKNFKEALIRRSFRCDAINRAVARISTAFSATAVQGYKPLIASVFTRKVVGA